MVTDLFWCRENQSAIPGVGRKAHVRRNDRYPDLDWHVRVFCEMIVVEVYVIHRPSNLSFPRLQRATQEKHVNRSAVNCDIKNVELADLGKKRIEWANQSMKVLQIIRKEFIKNQPLKGIRDFGVPARDGGDREPGNLPARWRGRRGAVRLESAVDAG